MLKEIEERRSARSFSDRPVEDEKLINILRAGQWAPSCYNNQPWHFVVLRGEETRRIHDAINRGNSWAKSSYMIIAVVSKRDLDCISNGREYYMFSCGLAVENMLLESYHQGLVAHSILGFNEDLVKERLSIPGEYRVLILLIIGYPGDEEMKDHKRERKNLEEIVHYGGW
ncbi:MAG: nitroreductase family protein [Thermoplasmata archaeon]|jgi:nitroreductase|nr:nitroreductase [Thermoplasmatales archaeon]HEU13104.1 nitroreductase [Euryarchaeota archaeon]